MPSARALLPLGAKWPQLLLCSFLSFSGKDTAPDREALLCSASVSGHWSAQGPCLEYVAAEGWGWGGRAQGGDRAALLRSASLAPGRSRGERSDMGSENKKSVSWVLPPGAGLAKFILGRNVKRTERRTKADLVPLQHLPSKRQ